MFDSIVTSIRQLFRSLAHWNPESRFLLTFAVTLGLGIAANMAVFSVLDAYLFHPLPYPQSRRLVMVYTTTRKFPIQALSSTAYHQLRQAPVFTDSGLIRQENTAIVRLHPGSLPRLLTAGFVTPSVFPTLGMVPLIGNGMSPQAGEPGGPREALLSAAIWRRAFGQDPHVLGQPITVNGHSYTIMGVMPGRFAFPTRQTSLWLSTRLKPAHFRNPFNRVDSMMLARLAPGTTRERLREALALEFHQLMRKADPILQNLVRQVDGRADTFSLRHWLVGATGKRLLIIQLGAGLLFFLALASLANLALVRSLGRHAEDALRAAVGASRRHALAASAGEALVLASVATLVAWPLARWGTHAFVSFGIASHRSAFEAHQGPERWILVWILAGLLSFLLLGLPRILLLRGNPRTLLAGGTRITGSGGVGRIRTGLSVAQITLAVLLLIATLFIGLSLNRMLTQNLGFNLQNLDVGQVVVPRQDDRHWSTFKTVEGRLDEALQHLPAGLSTAIGRNIPPLSASNYSLFAAGAHYTSGGRHVLASDVAVGPGTLAFMGVHLLSGRLIDAADIAENAHVAVVDRRFAKRLFGTTRVLGRLITGYNGATRIVGIVGSIRDRFIPSLRSVQGTVFFADNQRSFPLGAPVIDILIRSRESSSRVERTLKAELHRTLPDLVLSHFESMHRRVAQALRGTSALVTLLGTFGLLALLLASVGTFGVIAYLVDMREREFAVRESLGANPAKVIEMILRQGLWIWILGSTLGIAGAWWAILLLEHRFYGIHAPGPLVYGLPTLGVGLVVFCACALPALRLRHSQLSRVLRS
jgi:predicted permease